LAQGARRALETIGESDVTAYLEQAVENWQVAVVTELERLYRPEPAPAIQPRWFFRARSFPFQAARILGSDVGVEGAVGKVTGTN
jgi:hypothetical protein